MLNESELLDKLLALLSDALLVILLIMSFEELTARMASQNFSSEDEAKFGALSNEDKLVFYSLFKQGTIGDCNTTRPGMFDIVGKYKWDAWNSRKNMTCDEAKTAYFAKVEEMGFFKELTI